VPKAFAKGIPSGPLEEFVFLSIVILFFVWNLRFDY
jgi:hypothetical protein